jgi:hypothetical protein
MWKVTFEIDDQQLADWLYRVMLEKLSKELGMPEIKEVNGSLVCEYPGFESIGKVEKIIFNGIELERTPGEVAVSG